MIHSVRKRDGRREPFDSRKIASAITRASGACGPAERPPDAELCDVVCLFLERRYDDEVISSGAIRDAVDQVLRETGHARVAEAARRYDRMRAERRRRLVVQRSETQLDLWDDLDRPWVDGARRALSAPWDRRRIARALVAETEVAPDVAEDIARVVESRVLGSGLARLSTGLIRELVNAELFERHLTTPLARSAIYGLPRHDIDGLIAESGSRPAEVEHAVAAAVMRQYAMAEVLSPPAAEAHRVGAIHVAGLGRFARPWTARLGAGEARFSAPDPFTRARAIAHATRLAESRTAHGLVIEDLHAAFAADADAGTRAAAELFETLVRDEGARLSLDWLLSAGAGRRVAAMLFDAPVNMRAEG